MTSTNLPPWGETIPSIVDLGVAVMNLIERIESLEEKIRVLEADNTVFIGGK